MMKPSPPKRPTPIFFWNAMPIEMPLRRAQERVLLADELAAELARGASQDPARDRARRRRPAPCRPPWAVKTVMNRLSPVSTRLPAPSSAPISPLRLVLPAAVAEDRLHLDPGGHVHERAGLGDDALAGIELDLDELQVLALDLVVDLVRARHARAGRREGGIGGGSARRQVGPELVHLAAAASSSSMPLVKTSVVASALPLLIAFTTSCSSRGRPAGRRSPCTTARRRHSLLFSVLVRSLGRLAAGAAASMRAAASASSRATVAGRGRAGSRAGPGRCARRRSRDSSARTITKASV